MRPTFIIPYRNRKEHLQRLAPHLLPIGEVVVIEQADNRPFNRGKLLNIGFAIARETMDYCIFHDVDMIPIDPAIATDITRMQLPIWQGAAPSLG